MNILKLLILLFICQAINAWQIKETKTNALNSWEMIGETPKNEKIRLVFAVKQQNINILKDILYAVSDPDSHQYGQHLSKNELDALIAPKGDAVQSVLSYLHQVGIDDKQISHTDNYDFITVDTNIKIAESLLNTKYMLYRHKTNGNVISRCHYSYSLPNHLIQHIDFVGPTIRFPNLNVYPTSNRLKHNRALKQLGGIITPKILRELYNVNDYSATNPQNIQACASFLGQYYSPSDLQTFFNKFDTEAVGRTPVLYGPNSPSNPGVEASLDIQYVMAMGNNVSTQFWSTSGERPHGNEPFLTWLVNVSKLTDNELPKVFSVSYGDNEPDITHDFLTRVDQEYMKLGTRGVSILYASGDGGVAGGQAGLCTKFIPVWPAASPYVTSVGGTASSKPEVAASFSSGGFSNVYARPSYQEDAVQHFISTSTNLPAKENWNQTSAGFPDISAQSESFNVIMDGGSVPFGVEGTSCAAPTASGIFSLLNDVRMNAGKSSLGWLNPLLYKNANAFNDVQSGNNPGCGSNGFYAVAGWDPVTGLGTPDFAKLKEVVSQLP